jgi:hypothetical protein
MDNEAGEDLSWFWRGWFLHNWSLDLAVQSVRNLDAGSPSNAPATAGANSAAPAGSPSGPTPAGVEITLANLDRLALPAILELTWKDGTKQRIALPVETWLQSGTRTLRFPATQPLAAVVIDPDHVLPDGDRRNNDWKAGGN